MYALKSLLYYRDSKPSCDLHSSDDDDFETFPDWRKPPEGSSLPADEPGCSSGLRFERIYHVTCFSLFNDKPIIYSDLFSKWQQCRILSCLHVA